MNSVKLPGLRSIVEADILRFMHACPSVDSVTMVMRSERRRARETAKNARAEKLSLRVFSKRRPLSILARKYFTFLFSEIVFYISRPVPTRGAYRDRHDTRGG